MSESSTFVAGKTTDSVQEHTPEEAVDRRIAGLLDEPIWLSTNYTPGQCLTAKRHATPGTEAIF